MDEARQAEPFPTCEELARYLAGDVEAERRLFERHRDELLQRARRHRGMRSLGSRVSADDIVNDVFVRALVSGLFTRFRDQGPGSLAATLGAVLDHVVLDACRRRGALKRGSNVRHVSCDSMVEPMVAASTPTPTAQARRSEMLERCRQCLEPREWEAWRLTQDEGLDDAEVARRLGTTESAVRGLRLRARTKIVKFLSHDELR